MKRTAIILALIVVASNVHGQIPNNGFENWDGVNLSGWFINGNVTKSSDHYPASIGAYSIRLESQGPASNNSSYAFAMTGKYAPCSPTFPITGHPTNLCGYYKCSPMNNDTMQIGLMLFQHGVWIAGAEFKTTNIESDWKSFNVPISSYASADSAIIVLSAFYNDTNCGLPGGPYGNSILYVDNLSFDSLISDAPATVNRLPSRSSGVFGLYPNPASKTFMLNFNKPGYESMEVSIHSMNGILLKSEAVKKNKEIINVADLQNGAYTVTIKSRNSIETKKLTIQK